MANVLTVPLSGNIYFDDGSQDTTIPDLTGSAVSLGFDGYAGLTVTGYNTDSSDRFTVEGASGSLFSVSDSLTGTIFSVNDASGLPIIEVNSDATTDTIAIGEFGTNALFVSAGYVGVGTSTPTSTLDVSGDVNIDGVLTLHTAGKRVLSWLDVGTSWSFAGLPFFYKTAASTANRLDGVAPANLQTSQSASQIAQSVFNSYFNDIGGYSGAGTNFSRPIGVSFKAGLFIVGADSAKIRFMVGMTSTSGRYADEDPATTHGFGVEFRRAAGNVFEWRVYGHNGTTLTASAWSSSGIVYTIGSPRTIGMFSDGSGNITAYTSIYGDTNYTTITTTGGPTTTAGGTATQHVGAAASTNVSNYVTGALAQMRVIAVNFYTAP